MIDIVSVLLAAPPFAADEEEEVAAESARWRLRAGSEGYDGVRQRAGDAVSTRARVSQVDDVRTAVR